MPVPCNIRSLKENDSIFVYSKDGKRDILLLKCPLANLLQKEKWRVAIASLDFNFDE